MRSCLSWTKPRPGLDPVVRDEILHIFMEYLQNGERSILMSSHITSDLEKIADMVTFIDKGKILLTGYKDEIIERTVSSNATRRSLQRSTLRISSAYA